jgi:hypothetical protein
MPCLTFLSSACASFTPNQVYPMVHIYHRAISCRFHKGLPFSLSELVYHWFRASTLHGVGPLLSHVVMISLLPSCIHPVRLSKRVSSPIAPRIDSIWKFLPRWVMLSSTLEFEKVPFLVRVPDRVVEPRGWSNEAHYNQSHEAQSGSTRWDVTHAPKEKLHEGPRSSPPFNYPDTWYPSCYSVNASFIISCAPPPFINLGMRFPLRGRAVTPCVTVLLITS